MVGGHSMTWKTCKQPWNEPVCLGCMSNRMVTENPNPDHDITGKPVVCSDENHEPPTVVCSEQTTHPRFSRENQNLILEDVSHD